MHAMYNIAYNLVHDGTYVPTYVRQYNNNHQQHPAKVVEKEEQATAVTAKNKKRKSKTHLIFMHVKLHVLHEKNQREGKKNYDELEQRAIHTYTYLFIYCNHYFVTYHLCDLIDKWD